MVQATHQTWSELHTATMTTSYSSNLHTFTIRFSPTTTYDMMIIPCQSPLTHKTCMLQNLAV